MAELPKWGIAAWVGCLVVAGIAAASAMSHLRHVAEGALFVVDEASVTRLLQFQLAYGGLTLLLTLVAIGLTFAKKFDPAWKVGLITPILSIPLFFMGGICLEAAVLVLGAVGAYSVRQAAIGARMADLISEPDGE